MTETRAAPKTVPRRDIIEILGATYAHSGDWRSPIVELVGKRVVDSDALSDRQMFSRERDAEEYVLRIAKYEAETKLPLIESLFSGRRIRFKLWLARNWELVRRRSTGLLATHAIHKSKADLYRKVAENRFRPEVKRLPERLRVPAVIVLDTPIWVVDTEGFPTRPATIVEDRISALEYEDVGSSSDYDFRVRYRLAVTRGTFLYDHADTTCDVMSSPGLRVKAYIREEIARNSMKAFHQHVHAMLASSSEYTPLLTGPTEALIAISGPGAVERSEEGIVHDFDPIVEDADDDLLSLQRSNLLTIIETHASTMHAEPNTEVVDADEVFDEPQIPSNDGTVGETMLEQELETILNEAIDAPVDEPVEEDTNGNTTEDPEPALEPAIALPTLLEEFVSAQGEGAMVVHRLPGSSGRALLALGRVRQTQPQSSDAA